MLYYLTNSISLFSHSLIGYYEIGNHGCRMVLNFAIDFLHF